LSSLEEIAFTMSGTHKKRPAEQVLIVISERAATKKDLEPKIIEPEVLETYHIAVVLHNRFETFPMLLRETLQFNYTTTIQSHMKALGVNTITEYKYTYSIVSEIRVRQFNAETQSIICEDDIPSLSLANTTLLEKFARASKKCLENSSFVQLKTEESIVHPEFVQLHSVRRNEIGWGFDVNGCLSFYLVSKENAKLVEYAIFVQRVDFKVGDEG
jgi:hypothetical protein